MTQLSGFATTRYNEHDALIKKIVTDFNKNKQTYVGGTANQLTKVPDLTESFIKSWLIQETGGNDRRSLDA